MPFFQIHVVTAILLVREIHCLNVSMEQIHTENNGAATLHLTLQNVSELCQYRDVCKVNLTNVCALRLVKGKMEFMDYKNICHLCIDNICNNSGTEYSIVDSGSCENYLISRRNIANRTDFARNGTYAANKTVLRSKSKPVYKVQWSFDGHDCPYSCAQIYEPVCVNVNRATGLYSKFFSFINHCSADVFYCKNVEEFDRVPGFEEIENVEYPSKLAWSSCAANKFNLVARFSEFTASLAHYGWLGGGDHRFSKILTAEQKLPDYG